MKKKYADGGRADGKIDLEQDVKDFYHKHSSPDFRRKKISEMTGKDVARIPKEAALMVGTGVGVPLGAAVSGAYNLGVDAKQAVKDRFKTRRQLNAMPEEFSEPVDMSTPRLPRRVSTPDQMRSMAKEQDLKDRYGSSGRGMKKGGAVKMAKGGSASSRADGCAVRGKTKGRMV
jgi:hypothetical protein